MTFSEKEKPSILKLSFDYFHFKIIVIDRKTKTTYFKRNQTNQMSFDNSRRAFLYKTKLCKYLNSVDHDKNNCTFAHDLLELRTQDLRFQRQCRINARHSNVLLFVLNLTLQILKINHLKSSVSSKK